LAFAPPTQLPSCVRNGGVTMQVEGGNHCLSSGRPPPSYAYHIIEHHSPSLAIRRSQASRRDFFDAAATAIGVAAWIGGQGIAPANAIGFSGPTEALRARFGEKLRRAAKILDELQQDIANEDWDLIATYPSSLRALVPVFTKYTDAAFPSDDPIDMNSRVALRYEVGRFFGAVERLKRAAEAQDSKETEQAFAAISVAYDR
ncbi:unnamed protein product, partial [Chrysoparadoxa australica]